MEQSADRTGFPLWRALALGSFAAAAFTAIALFGGTSSAHADDGGAPADPGLLGAATQLVGSVQEPLDAVAGVVDAVDTTVVTPVVSAVDDTVASVPVVGDVVDQTLGEAPVSAIVEPVVGTVGQTVTDVGEALGAAAVPVVPVLPVVPTSPSDPAAPAGAAPGGDVAASLSGPVPEGANALTPSTVVSDGYAAWLAGDVPTLPVGAVGALPPASPADVPLSPRGDLAWAVTPGSSSAGSAGTANGSPTAADVSGADTPPALCADRRGPARDDDLPPAPTFPSDTSPD